MKDQWNQKRPNTSFQRTLTRGGCGPLNSDREAGQVGRMSSRSITHRWGKGSAKPEAGFRTPLVKRASDVTAEIMSAPNTSFQRTPTRGGCGPLNSDR